MEKLKMIEIREMSTEELEKRVADELQSLGNLRFQHATTRIQNTDNLKKSRHLIARMKTVLRERELGLSVRHESADKGNTGTPEKAADKKQETKEKTTE